MRLLALTCGWLTGPTASFLDGEPGRLRVPVPCYLIDHPSGTVLFDSGMHPDAGVDPAARLGFAASVFQVDCARIVPARSHPNPLHPMRDSSRCPSGRG